LISRRSKPKPEGARAIEQAAVPDLIQTLSGDVDHFTRICAAEAIGEIAPDDIKVLSALSDALRNDKDPSVRGFVAIILSSKATSVKATLTAALINPDANVRLQAAQAIGNVKDERYADISALQRALSDSDQRVREQAKSTLEALGYAD